MTNTPEVAMTVIEPGGRRWAQLLDISRLVRDLLPLIVNRLDLPEQLTYELQHVRSERVLKAGDTLQGIGIVAGEELLLKPVRNKFLYDLLDKLYDEAVGYVAKQLWGQAESRLETILRLDPEYPDPKAIWPLVAARGGTAASGSASFAKGEPATSAGSGPAEYAPAKPVASTTYTPPPAASAPPVAPATQMPQAAAKQPRSACFVLVMIIGGIFLVGAILVAAAFAWFTLRSPEEFTGGGTIPTIEGEPVLGTGDVQMTLRWDNSADLDLHVTDPSGEEIWYMSPSATSGGQLDVDANGLCNGDPQVENIYWPTGGAPSGSYDVSVVYYGACDSTGPANYEVSILVNGQTVDVRTGTLSAEGEAQFVGSYSR